MSRDKQTEREKKNYNKERYERKRDRERERGRQRNRERESKTETDNKTQTWSETKEENEKERQRMSSRLADTDISRESGVASNSSCVPATPGTERSRHSSLHSASDETVINGIKNFHDGEWTIKSSLKTFLVRTMSPGAEITDFYPHRRPHPLSALSLSLPLVSFPAFFSLHFTYYAFLFLLFLHSHIFLDLLSTILLFPPTISSP